MKAVTIYYDPSEPLTDEMIDLLWPNKRKADARMRDLLKGASSEGCVQQISTGKGSGQIKKSG